MLRIDRPTNENASANLDQLTRHKASLVLDLKNADSLSVLRKLLTKADVLIDPYRPGTLESLGLRPETLLCDNPRLIISRLTGFRRDGKYKDMAGHDINYLAVSGILSQLGRKGQPPYTPANILADFAGGGLMCVIGILLALIKRGQTGKGQVVEANMVDGSAYLGTFMRLARKTPMWDQPRGENILDGGCPFYDVYECKDGGFMAVGALEEKFYQILVEGLGLGNSWIEERWDRSRWGEQRNVMTQTFEKKTRREWEAVFDGKDACCTPVLGQTELEETGYEQRSAVTLTQSPALEVPNNETILDPTLSLGHGGEQVLQDWTGWKRERDYAIIDNSYASVARVKL